jgi:hypothetical protein
MADTTRTTLLLKMLGLVHMGSPGNGKPNASPKSNATRCHQLIWHTRDCFGWSAEVTSILVTTAPSTQLVAVIASCSHEETYPTTGVGGQYSVTWHMLYMAWLILDCNTNGGYNPQGSLIKDVKVSEHGRSGRRKAKCFTKTNGIAQACQ